MPKKFTFCCEWAELLVGCPAKVRLEVYDAIIEYAQSGTLPQLKSQARLIMDIIKKEIDKEKDLSEKRAQAGRKGGYVKAANKQILANPSKTKQILAKPSKTNFATICYNLLENDVNNITENADKQGDVSNTDKNFATNNDDNFNTENKNQEKEKNKEKENTPHTPYKEKEINKEKEVCNKRAHAREKSEKIEQEQFLFQKTLREEEKIENKHLARAPANNTGTKYFVKPTINDIENYVKQKGLTLDANHFYDYYTSNGWKVGRNAMKDWKATVRNWCRTNAQKQIKQNNYDQQQQSIARRQQDIQNLVGQLINSNNDENEQYQEILKSLNRGNSNT